MCVTIVVANKYADSGMEGDAGDAKVARRLHQWTTIVLPVCVVLTWLVLFVTVDRSPLMQMQIFPGDGQVFVYHPD